MAAGHVQSTGIQSTGTPASVSKAFGSNVTAGNFIAAFGTSNTIVPGTGAMSDTLSNTYTRDIVGAAASPGCAIYSAPNIAGGACTVTFAVGTDSQSIGISEFSGMALTSPLDGTPQTASGTDNAPTANITTGSAGISIGVVTQSNGVATITVGSGYTLGFEDEDSTDMPIGTEWQLTAAGTRAVNWTLTNSPPWRICVAGYKEAAASTDVLLTSRVKMGFRNNRGPMGSGGIGGFF